MNDNAIKGLLVTISLLLLAICVLSTALRFGPLGALVCVAGGIVGYFGLGMLGDAVQRAQYRLPRKAFLPLPPRQTASLT